MAAAAAGSSADVDPVDQKVVRVRDRATGGGSFLGDHFEHAAHVFGRERLAVPSELRRSGQTPSKRAARRNGARIGHVVGQPDGYPRLLQGPGQELDVIEPVVLGRRS